MPEQHETAAAAVAAAHGPEDIYSTVAM